MAINKPRCSLCQINSKLPWTYLEISRYYAQEFNVPQVLIYLLSTQLWPIDGPIDWPGFVFLVAFIDALQKQHRAEISMFSMLCYYCYVNLSKQISIMFLS